MVLRGDWDPAGGHGGSLNCEEVRMKNLVHIDLVHLDQDFGESDTRWFIPNKLKHIIWGNVYWCDTIPGRKIINYIET